MLQINMIGVRTLDGYGLFAGHFGLKIRILTEAFPNTGPAGVTAKVHDRREHPRDLRSAGFIGHRTAQQTRIFTVESGAKINLLRIKTTIRKISGTMNHINAINARYADQIHGNFLNLANHCSRLLTGMGTVVHHIQDGTNLISAQNKLQLCRIKGFAGFVLQHGDVQLDQLAGLFLQRHAFEDLFHLCFNGFIGRNGIGALWGAGNGKNAKQNQTLSHISSFTLNSWSPSTRNCTRPLKEGRVKADCPGAGLSLSLNAGPVPRQKGAAS